MSYQVLARKWRPQTFADVVGQQHVLSAISNGLSLGRIHHAYLFSGTRGVGKTTIARLLAKGLNCESGITATPCGKCDNCREIEEGRFVDLIEIDAASRTKVEDTRDILDNVQYAPARGRFKVYLIDEVHMLSRHSFNALLKTLEEPPEHVKFLLATTDPQKLPITILSRCLQFHLKALSSEQIATQLEHVLGAENINSEQRALQLIARAADGSMRDALSLTDQAIAMGNGAITADIASQMLGTLDDEQPLALVEALMQADGKAMMAQIEQAASRGVDWDSLLVETLSVLHQVAMVQLLSTPVEQSFNEQRLKELARVIPPQDLQLYYQTLLIGRKELTYAPDRRTGVEMTFLRALAFHPKSVPTVEHINAQPKTVAPVNAEQPVLAEVMQPQSQQSVLNKPVVPSQPVKSAEVKKAPPQPDISEHVSGAMAQLLQARSQLQQKLQEPLENQKKSGSTLNIKKESTKKENTKKESTSPLERLVSAVDSHAKKAAITPGTDEKETKKESYRWKAQNIEPQQAQTMAVTPKNLKAALEHEKTPELIVKLAHEAALRDRWSAEIETLTIPKLVQQLALNAFKEERSENEVCLHLRSAQKHLNTQAALDALTNALSHTAGHTIALTIIEDDNLATKTPLEWRQAIYEDMLAKAKQSLADDEHVKTLCRFFDAELDDDSIRPV